MLKAADAPRQQTLRTRTLDAMDRILFLLALHATCIATLVIRGEIKQVIRRYIVRVPVLGQIFHPVAVRLKMKIFLIKR